MRLLDLFCGGGGAAMGYHQAGFDEIVGVDIRPQPRYPFTFVRADALDYVREHGNEFDVIHASPPCQVYSRSKHLAADHHADLIEPVRMALKASGKPYIIENVPGAPLVNPTLLCGLMFDLRVFRHRIFETSFGVPFTLHSPHHCRPVKMGRPVKHGEYIHVVGNFSNVPYARMAMGIEWLGQRELSQAIPPAYTRYIGGVLLNQHAR